MKFSKYLVIIFLLLTNHAKAQVNNADSLALVDLYNQCNGTNWTNNSGWLITNVAGWQGVTVASNRVTELSLNNNLLNGNLPSSFCNLTALKYLYVSGNNLSGILPACFSLLTQLNTIDLHNNAFSGAIPAGITSFSQLADLLVEGNKFSNLPDMSAMPELSNLNIYDNRFTFEDILPNTSIINFQYTPQDSIGIRIDTLVDIKIRFICLVLLPESETITSGTSQVLC
jgi:hypothetical protein